MKIKTRHVVITIIVGTVIVFAILLATKTIELFKKKEESGKGCCACSAKAGCKKYTALAEAHMNKEEYPMLSSKCRSAPVQIAGTLVDMRCYSQNYYNTNDTHVTADGGKMPGCGTACLKIGVPCGLLKDGRAGNPVYVLLTGSIALAPHIAKHAVVKGRLMKDSGALFPTSILVEGKNVMISAMM